MAPVDAVLQDVKGHFAHFVQRHVHAGKHGAGVLHVFDVVHAHQGDVLRDAQAPVLAGAQRADGHHVVAAEHRRHLAGAVQQAQHGLVAALHGKHGIVHHIAGVIGQAQRLQRGAVARVAAFVAAHIADAPVVQPVKIFHAAAGNVKPVADHLVAVHVQLVQPDVDHLFEVPPHPAQQVAFKTAQHHQRVRGRGPEGLLQVGAVQIHGRKGVVQQIVVFKGLPLNDARQQRVEQVVLGLLRRAGVHTVQRAHFGRPGVRRPLQRPGGGVGHIALAAGRVPDARLQLLAGGAGALGVQHTGHGGNGYAYFFCDVLQRHRITLSKRKI